MGILIQIVLFGIAAGLGAWWFTVIVLPIFYGLPRSIFWTIRGKLKSTSSLVYLLTFLLWTFLFTLAAILLLKLLPQAATYLYNSPGFFYGQWFGVFGALLRAISKSGRKNLKEDFWGAMAKFEKEVSSSESEFYTDLIGKYGELLDARKGYVGRESDLPAPKSEIRKAIEWARTDSIFSMEGKALDVGWESLDTFIPDEEYAQTSQVLDEAISALMSGDNNKYQNLVAELPENQKLLVTKIFKIASLGK